MGRANQPEDSPGIRDKCFQHWGQQAGAQGGRLWGPWPQCRSGLSRGFPFKGDLELLHEGSALPGGRNGVFGRVSETLRAADRRQGSALSRALTISRAEQRRARGHLQRRQPCERPQRAGGERGGTMALKKDSNAVSIDMLLIVHSEKRRSAQGTHSDQQADPGALQQRRGGNARPARLPEAPAPRPLLPRAHPPWGRPTRPRTRSATPTLSPWLPAPRRCGSGVPWQRAAP